MFCSHTHSCAFVQIHEQHPDPSEMLFMCYTVFFSICSLFLPTQHYLWFSLKSKRVWDAIYLFPCLHNILWCGCASHTWNLRYILSLHCYYNNILKYFEIATLKLWFPTRGNILFPQGTQSNLWRHFWLSHGRCQ